jgi:hypothetical protein
MATSPANNPRDAATLSPAAARARVDQNLAIEVQKPVRSAVTSIGS